MPDPAGGDPAARGRGRTAAGPGGLPGLEVDVVVRRGERAFVARLDVAPGEIALVVGPSGAGKTTIVRALAGLARPDAGTVRCAGRPWFDADGRIDLRPRDRHVGVVVQELALFPHLSAWRTVAFAAEGGRGGVSRGRAGRPGSATARGGGREGAVALLDRLGLAARVDARPAALSGGERQRVALARALARPSQALLLDEPFSALDDETHDRAAEIVREHVGARALPAVVVSHDPADAERLGARTFAMRDDTLVEVGRPAA